MIFDMKMVRKTAFAFLTAIAFTFPLAGCSEAGVDQTAVSEEEKAPSPVSEAVNFAHELDSYTPGRTATISISPIRSSTRGGMR